MREIKVNADIRMEIPDGITEEEANALMYDVMYDCLCNNVGRVIDFEIYDREVREKY